MTTAERHLHTRLLAGRDAHPLPTDSSLVLSALPTGRRKSRTGLMVHAGWGLFLLAVAAMVVGLTLSQPSALMGGIGLALAALMLAKTGAAIAAQPMTDQVTARRLLLSGLVDAD